MYPASSWFDHSAFDGILERRVKNGQVDYKAIRQNDAKALDGYLKALGTAKPDNFNSDKERLAFYINAYNAFVIKGILSRGSPATTIGKGIFFYKDKYLLAGEKINLYNLENGIIRKKFKEPRVHFALVCASKSCPGLKAKAFTSDNLNQLLDEAAKGFINDTDKNRVDHARKKLYLSKIFKWYARDFKAHGGVEKFVLKYLNDKDKALVSKGGYDIKYLEYDWSLNGVL